jgi:hypothetical protein
MVKRVVVVPLWFVSTWLTYGLVAYVLGVPESGGAVLGALTAGLVFMDPTGVFWGRRNEEASIAPSRLAAESRPGAAAR